MYFPVLYVSIGQVIGLEDRIWNDLDCVWWGVWHYSYSYSFDWSYFGDLWPRL